MCNTGAAGRVSHWREIPHAQRAPAAVLDVQHGEGGGSFLCACDAGGAGRLHDGSNAGSGCGKRTLPFSGTEICRGSRAAAPPAGKFPMRPERARRACRSIGSGAGDRRSNGRRGRSSGCDRPRRPDAHAHAGHASRTLFANATAAIFLRRICLCRYIPTQIFSTAAIFYRRYYCCCSYTHITYSQRPPHSPHPLLTQS